MRRFSSAWTCLSLFAAVCLLLAGCGGVGAGGGSAGASAPPGVAVEEEVLQNAGEAAAAAGQELLNPTGALRQNAVATGQAEGKSVVIFQLDIPVTGGGDGFAAVSFDLENIYFSDAALLEAAAFKRVEIDRGQTPAVYTLGTDTVQIDSIAYREGAEGAGPEGVQYAISDEWKRTLRDTTWADWVQEGQAGEEWGLEYCRSLISFFADTGVPVSGAFSDPAVLKKAIDDKGGKDGDIVYKIACTVMALDPAYYYDFIVVVAPE